jgi:hypothetical protein
VGAFDDCRIRRLTMIRSSMARTLVSPPTPALTQTLSAKADRTFGLQGARTMLATAFARRTFSRSALTVQEAMGRTRAVAHGGDPNHSDGRIVSSAFSVEGARPMLGGFAMLGLSSPLRVERASASFLAPVAYDLVSGSFVEERRTFDLTPTLRELDLRLG